MACGDALTVADHLKRFRRCPRCRKHHVRGVTRGTQTEAQAHAFRGPVNVRTVKTPRESWWVDAPQVGLTALAMTRNFWDDSTLAMNHQGFGDV